MAKSFSIKEAVNYGWGKTKENFWFLVSLALINAIISGLTQKVGKQDGAETFNFVLFLIQLAASTIINIGLINVALKLIDKKEVSYNDITEKINLFWKFLGASILYSLIVGFGFALLIIPGIYWALKYQFALNILVDKNTRVFEAFNKSGEMTKGLKLRILVFDLALLGVLILGVLALGVGVLVATPVIWIAEMYVYRKLISK